MTNAAGLDLDPHPTGLRLWNISLDQLKRSTSARDATPLGSLWRVWARITAYWDKWDKSFRAQKRAPSHGINDRIAHLEHHLQVTGLNRDGQNYCGLQRSCDS